MLGVLFVRVYSLMYDLYIRPWEQGNWRLPKKTAERAYRAAGERYTRIFSEKDVERHLAALGRLSPPSVEVLLDPRRDGTLDCTVWPLITLPSFPYHRHPCRHGLQHCLREVFTDEGIPQSPIKRERLEKEDLRKGAGSSISSPGSWTHAVS